MDPTSAAFEMRYRDGPAFERCALDFTSPDKPGSPPLLVFVHGGAWVSGDKSLYRGLAGALAVHGVATAVPNYRLSAGGGVRHPCHVEDLAACIAYLSARGHEMGFDPARISVAGHSAGAHMAAMLAANPRYLDEAGIQEGLRTKSYIGIEGIFDLIDLERRWPEYREWFLETAFGPRSLWEAASPARLPISSRSPWLLVHSASDELVDAGQTTSFRLRLEGCGTPAEFWDPGPKSHFGVVEDLSDPADPTLVRIAGFLSE